MIFSHRHYCNICQVQRPINSNASDQDCSIFLQHFEEESKFEKVKKFKTTDALLYKMDQILQFSNFLKLKLFPGSLLNIINMISE